MVTYVDAWSGFQLSYPEGWRTAYPPIEGVAFLPADGTRFLEFSVVEAPDARTAVDERLRKFNASESRQLTTGADQAGVTFRDAQSEGQLHARWRDGRATVVLAQAAAQASGDPAARAATLQTLVTDLTTSLQPSTPIGRRPWQEPTEAAFSLLCPEGWQVQSQLVPGSGGRNLTARIALSASTYVGIEPAIQSFVNGPPEMFGDISLPLQGLMPMLQQFLLPQWGPVEVLAFDDFGNPLKAEVRLRLPDGVIRVVSLLANATPNSNRWFGGVAGYYQAPADELPACEAVLRGVLASPKVSPQWQARESGFRQQQMSNQYAEQQQWSNLQNNLHQQRMGDIQRQGQNNTYLHQQRMETHDLQFQGYQQASASSDQRHHDSVNAIRERSDYYDAGAQQMYSVADGHERVFADNSGNLFAGDWSFTPPAEWSELRRMQPGEWHD